MATFLEDSSDDETGVNLQLAERLRIDRGEHTLPTACEEKNIKELINQRNRQFSEYLSSSSSSLEMHYDNPLTPHNKKRQSGDKGVEHIANPKRTCLSGGLRRSPVRRKRLFDGRTEKIVRLPPTSPRNLPPDRMYEEDDEDDFEPQTTFRERIARACRNEPVESKEKSMHRFRRARFVDSTSEDDSRGVRQNGSLKGGRQSPDVVARKKFPSRKAKVLDSDSDEDWLPNYRHQPMLFTSSDSEDSAPGRKVANSPAKSANNPFLPADPSLHSSHDHSYFKPEAMDTTDPALPSTSGGHRAKSSGKRSMKTLGRVLPTQPTVQITPINNISISLHSGRDGRYAERPSSGVASPKNRAHRNYRCSSKSPKGRSFPNTRASPGYWFNGPQHSIAPLDHLLAQQSSNLPNPSLFQENNARPSTVPTVPDSAMYTRSYLERPRTGVSPFVVPTRRYKNSLVALYPDVFDAEESSEVEFFTANSYSDNESNESVANNANPAGLSGQQNPASASNMPVLPPQDLVTVCSSEDEISVIYSNTPPRMEQRRGSSRTLGRRYNRRAGHHPGSQDLVSLSPDPVEQVRQVEEDERMARMLQAQFDAEMNPSYVPCSQPLLTNLHSPLSDTESSESRDDDSSDGLPFDSPMADLRNSIALMRGRHPPLIQSFNLSLNRRNSVNFTIGTGLQRMTNVRNPMEDAFGRGRFGFIESIEDTYEAFLGLADINGDVPRGLHRTEINRLPTRKYAVPNGASSSTEKLHKRAELNKECQVCLNDYVDGDILRILPCFHEFHTPCIDPWLKINYTCPVCRVVVDVQL